MKDIRIFSGKQVHPVLNTVLGLLECRQDNPIYKELEDSFHELEQEVKKRAMPKAALVFDVIKGDEPAGVLAVGSEVLYMVVTVGDGITKLSKKYFDQGDYLNGMLVDAMADSCLFQFEEELLPNIKAMCQEHGCGVARRYEAPTDIPMELQKTAFEAVEADRTLGLGISSGYMYHPVKSVCQVFELTADEQRFELEHNCANCSKKDCPIRTVYSVKLHVTSAKGEQTFLCPKGSSLLQELQEHKVFVDAVCGGKGRCGKCKVQVTKGTLPVGPEEEAFFDKSELVAGMRLACTARLFEDLEIVIGVGGESGFEVLGADVRPSDAPKGVSCQGMPDEIYGMAVDIGTTTLAVSLVGLSDGQIYDTYTAMNSQRAFGADVISRMQASIEGQSDQLKQAVQSDLTNAFLALINRNRIESASVKKVVIAANTTMLHLLMGYSCKTLGVHPFTPVTLKQQSFPFVQVFGREVNMEAEVILLPGISTFVGADITCGLYQCGFHERKKVSLLVDLGTNGEMAIGCRDKLLVTSTAAGPAFEGGNITFGTGSIQGAVSRVCIADGQAEVSTIGDAAPVGICGTGVVEAAAELLRTGLVDETGMLDEEYFDEGYPLTHDAGGNTIFFTQKDVREIQLAKSAIRAGIETLLLRYGITYDELDKVYLAGGFGFFMDRQKAAAIGMLPRELVEKTAAVGNTSLNGAIRFLTDEKAAATLDILTEGAKEIPLAADAKFNEFYMEYMMFEA